jgi:hypothetical protein
MNAKQNSIIPIEQIAGKILVIRDEKVLLDFHLAEFYGIENRVLKQAVRRNFNRFPNDFLFELTDKEIDEMVSQSVIPSKSQFGGSRPFAFTEAGVAMLSSVLNSKEAIQINIAIMRAFIMLRKMIGNYEELIKRQESMEGKLAAFDMNFLIIFDYLKKFDEERELKKLQDNRKRIGFMQEKDSTHE